MVPGRHKSFQRAQAAGYFAGQPGRHRSRGIYVLIFCLFLLPALLSGNSDRLVIVNDTFPLDVDLEVGRFGTGRLYFDDPLDLAVNEDGDVFILDSGNYRMQVMDEDGDFLEKWDLRQPSGKKIEKPAAMALSFDEDFIVVLDTDENEIRRYDTKGSFLNTFGESGLGKGKLDEPVDLTVDSLGYVYVLDRGKGRVLKYHRKGDFVDEWGRKGRGEKDFVDPVSIAYSDELTGIIYVLDAGKKALLKFQRDGDHRGNIPIPPEILGNGAWLIKLEAGRDNNLFILDAGLGRLTRLGTRSFDVFQLADESRRLQQIRGLAVDAKGRVYVSDIKRNRVYRFPMGVN